VLTRPENHCCLKTLGLGPKANLDYEAPLATETENKAATAIAAVERDKGPNFYRQGPPYSTRVRRSGRCTPSWSWTPWNRRSSLRLPRFPIS
jgi:hypothetical protein